MSQSGIILTPLISTQYSQTVRITVTATQLMDTVTANLLATATATRLVMVMATLLVTATATRLVMVMATRLMDTVTATLLVTATATRLMAATVHQAILCLIQILKPQYSP